jgi:hypothetical protein
MSRRRDADKEVTPLLAAVKGFPSKVKRQGLEGDKIGGNHVSQVRE